MGLEVIVAKLDGLISKFDTLLSLGLHHVQAGETAAEIIKGFLVVSLPVIEGKEVEVGDVVEGVQF